MGICGKKFIGSTSDFNLLKTIDSLTDDDLASRQNEIDHCLESINAYINGENRQAKIDFSFNSIIQLNDLLEGHVLENHELLQSLYMSIFARYNDDIKTDENYHVTPEFVNLVYTFQGEELPEKIKDKHSSEPDVGIIFMTQDEYDKLIEVWKKDFNDEFERRDAFKTEIVTYTLSNIRNRMMHGDYENIRDKEGNDIVRINPNSFKAKFFFDCILEFYEAISTEIQNRTGKEDSLFDLEKALLNPQEEKSDILKDDDKLMSAILPMYINSFITYNFNDSKKGIQKLRTSMLNNQNMVRFLDLYYKKGDEDSFAYKISKYNKDQYGVEYSAYDIINHFRNSIVHNNYKCEQDTVYVKDFNPEGQETARFVIPYDFIKELIHDQSEQAKYALRVESLINSSSPEDHDADSNSER